MRTRRTGTIIAHILASIAIGFIAVAVGILVSNAVDPTDMFRRAVPILIGALVAVGGGLCAARLVPWLVAGGLRSMLPSDGVDPSGPAAEQHRAAHPRR